MKVLDYDGLQYYDSLISSMYLKKSGGTMTGSLNTKRINNQFDFSKGTIPSATKYAAMYFADKDGSDYSPNCIGLVESSVNASNLSSTYIRAIKNEAGSTTSCSIACYVDADGNAYTSAPTPTAGDNSTKIATTAFVNTKAGNYLPLAGGTLTGAVTTASNIVLNKSGTSPVLGTPIVLPVVYKTKTTASGNAVYDTSPFFVFPTSDTSNNGTGFGIQTGGALVIGGGESPRALVSALTLNGGTENAYLTADSTVYIVTNGGTIANRKTFAFTTDGKIQFPDGSTIWIA